MKLRQRIRFILLACAVTCSTPAFAQSGASAKDQAQAQKDYVKAQKLYDQGNLADALELFREVFKVTNSPNARMWIGNCLVKLDRNAEAYEEMSAAMKEAAKRVAKEPKYTKTRDSAGAELAKLEQKVGKAVIVVVGGQPSKALLNGDQLALEKLGIPVAVEPGTARVEVTRADGSVLKGEAEIGAGETKTITLSAGGEKTNDTQVVQGPAQPDKPEEPTPKTSSGGGLRVAGYVVTGLGVLGLGAFGVAGMMAKGELDKLESECGGQRCTDPAYGDVVDRGKTFALVANIGLFAGIACVGAGIPMIIFGGPKENKSDTGFVGPSLHMSPGGMGISYRGHF